ncbi:MAG: Fic family protein [Verrucomicrobiota bacterium]
MLNALRQTPLGMKELVTVLGLKSKTGALKRTVNELLSGNWIEYTIPAKPTSRLQKYRITPLGKEVLKRHTNREANGK